MGDLIDVIERKDREISRLRAERARLLAAIHQHRVDTMHYDGWPTSDDGFAAADRRLWSVLDDNEEARR